jgi:hypothetical protein
MTIVVLRHRITEAVVWLLIGVACASIAFYVHSTAPKPIDKGQRIQDPHGTARAAVTIFAFALSGAAFGFSLKSLFNGLSLLPFVGIFFWLAVFWVRAMVLRG